MSTTYLKLFVDCLEKYQKLNDTEFGRLVRASLRYKATGAEPNDLGREALLWDGMRLDIDRDNENYSAVLNARSEAGKKGAKSRWQSHLENSKNSKCHLPYGKNGQDKEEEKDKDKEEKEKTPTVSKRKFVAPTVDEVRAYCLARKNGIDAQSFVDFYEARGWMVGKNHMKDWRAAVRTWENHRKEVGRTIRGQEDGYGEAGTAAEDSERTFHGWRAKSALDEPD